MSTTIHKGSILQRILRCVAIRQGTINKENYECKFEYLEHEVNKSGRLSKDIKKIDSDQIN